MARFGTDINSILDRETHAGVSVLAQLDAALTLFDRYYVYEQVEGFSRNRHERIPREAFREAVANALAHRAWDVGAHIRVSMHDDRVEVSSPGGLPKGVEMNPGAYAHTSIAIADCIRAISTPVVEVHITDISKRESYRHHSFTAEACKKCISGLGLGGYESAVRELLGVQV